SRPAVARLEGVAVWRTGVPRLRHGGGAIVRRHRLAGVARAELSALREVRGGGVLVRLRKLIRGQEHFESGGAASLARAGAEGEPENDESVQEPREEQHGQQPVPDRRLAFPKFESSPCHRVGAPQPTTTVSWFARHCLAAQ